MAAKKTTGRKTAARKAPARRKSTGVRLPARLVAGSELHGVRRPSVRDPSLALGVRARFRRCLPDRAAAAPGHIIGLDADERGGLMKIEATCDRCSRTFLLKQIGPESDAPGRCPFCGARFARHYSTVLVDAVEDAEDSAVRFVNTIARLQSMETGFDIDVEGLLAVVSKQVREQQTAAEAV